MTMMPMSPLERKVSTSKAIARSRKAKVAHAREPFRRVSHGVVISGSFPLFENIDDAARQQMAMPAGPRRYQVAINHQVLIDEFRAIGHRIAMQIVVAGGAVRL